MIEIHRYPDQPDPGGRIHIAFTGCWCQPVRVTDLDQPGRVAYLHTNTDIAGGLS